MGEDDGRAGTTGGLYARIRAHFADPDPRATLANTIALIVLSNQPFYPAYLAWVLGTRAWPALLAWATIPLLIAVPRLGRSDPPAAAALLIAAGIMNTGLGTLAFGPATWVELFHLPCLLLGALLVTGRWRWPGFVALVALAALFALKARLMPSGGLAGLSADEAASLARINMTSAAGLTLVILWLARGLPRAR